MKCHGVTPFHRLIRVEQCATAIAALAEAGATVIVTVECQKW